MPKTNDEPNNMLKENYLIPRKKYDNLIEHSLGFIRDGKIQIILVEGEDGVGKTTLLHEIPEPSGTIKIHIQANELRSSPFGIIRQILDIVEGKKLIDGNSSIRFSTDRKLFYPDNLKASVATLDELTSAFSNIMKMTTIIQPLIILIDDIQWADSGSLTVLGNFVKQNDHLPLLLVLSCRNDNLDREHPVRKVRSILRQLPLAQEIVMQPFSREELREYLMKKYGAKPDENLEDLLLQQTAGLPFFVSEIVDHLWKKELIIESNNGLTLQQNDRIPIPESIKDMLFLKMEHLSENAYQLAEVAASYALEFEFSFIEQFTDSASCIDELLKTGIIIEKNPGIGVFYHALYRETILSGILWSRRKEIYAKIAEKLEDRKAAPSTLAEFWLKAGNKEKARPVLIRSAYQSCDVYAYTDAAKWAEAALKDWQEGDDEDQRIKLLEKLASCSRINGEITNAIKALKEIANSAIVKSKSEKLASVYRELTLAYELTGAWNQYEKVKKKTITLFEEIGDNYSLAIEQMELTGLMLKELRLQEAKDLIELAEKNAALSGDKVLYARIIALKGYTLGLYGDIEKAYEVAKQSVSLALNTNDLLAISESQRYFAGTLEYASDFNKSIKAYEVALNFCEVNNLNFQETQCLGCMSWVLFRLGEWRKSFETCRQVLSNTRSLEISKCTASSILALMRAYRGELKSAKKHLKETEAIARHTSSNVHALISLWPKAIISLIEQDHKTTKSNFGKMLDFWVHTEDRHDSLPGLCDAVSFFTLHHEEKALNRCVEALTTIANHTRNNEALGILSFALGASLHIRREDAAALEHYKKSLEYIETASTPLQKAIIKYHTSCAFLNTEETTMRQKYLEEAHAILKTLGVRYWCNIIEREQKETAADPGNKIKSMISNYSLTSRQLEILNLLTTGMSNKEIAANIFLSTRTIDMHVRNIFDRLNCRSRAEAVRIALEEGIIKI